MDNCFLCVDRTPYTFLSLKPLKSGAKRIPHWTESTEVQSSRVGSLILSLIITEFNTFLLMCK